VSKNVLQQICTTQEDQEAVMGFPGMPASPAASAERKPARAYIPCPECAKLMNRRNFAGLSGVILDWCKSHGTWFDRNELKQIVLFVRGGGLRKAREKEKAKLEEEKQHLREEQRNLARLTRLGENSPLGLTASEDSDSLLRLFSAAWSSLDD
jgi:Zn-finger nucleic acid-binding protein